MLSIIEINNDSIFMDARVIKGSQYSKFLSIEKLKEIIHQNSQALIRKSVHEYIEKKVSGYTEGLSDAQNAYIEEHSSCSRKYSEELAEIENKMIEIISEVTQKVAYSVSSTEYIKGAVMDALATYRDDLVLTYVSPTQRETVESLEEDIKNKYGQTQLKVRFDENMEETGCIVETRFGMVDLSRDTKIKNYRAALERAMEENL